MEDHVADEFRSKGLLVVDRLADDAVDAHGRKLFDFPIKCSGCSGCSWRGCSGCSGCKTYFKCWGVSLAINGLNMDQTCDLLEKFEGIGGDWGLDDYLREIPEFVGLFAQVRSVLWLWSMSNCNALTNDLNQFNKYGADAVFYYPKGIAKSRAAGPSAA